MRRGDIVVVSLPGDFGKPRPAVVVQSDSLAASDSVIVCPLTSVLRPPSPLRVDVGPAGETGLERTSRLMVDKVTALRRERCKGPIGRLSREEVAS